MPFNPLPGYAASVTIGATTFAFDEFKFSPKNKLSNVSNFNSGGYEQYIVGFSGGKITCSGPYDEGNMPFAVGTAYTLVLGYKTGVTVSVPVICESIDVDVKADDAERVSIGFQTTGSFTAAIA